MTIEGPWRRLIPEQIKNVPDYPGVYELADILQEMIYIGSASSLVQAIEQVYERRDPDLKTAAFFRFQLTQDYEKEHKRLLEEFRVQFNRLPVCNAKKELDNPDTNSKSS
ncbi:MAG: GIY-YIG nuclease family protein [candidate division WOR-3 bacterium]